MYVRNNYDDNKPKKPRTPAARIGTNATVLSSEKSNIPEMTRLIEDKHDSSRCDSLSRSTAAMLITLLTYDFMSPHDRYSAVFVTLPVYKTSYNAIAHIMYVYKEKIVPYSILIPVFRQSARK